MMEQILKIDFQNFHISWNVSKSMSWTFLGSLHNETIAKYVFHEMFWKKYFAVYSRHKADLHSTNESLTTDTVCWQTVFFSVSFWGERNVQFT